MLVKLTGRQMNLIVARLRSIGEENGDEGEPSSGGVAGQPF